MGVNIFLRELRDIWEKAEPEPSKIAIKTARQLGIVNVERYESALVRINLEYCKKKKCEKCPARDECKEKRVRDFKRPDEA